MEKFDLVVIGAGSGLNTVAMAAADGKTVALVEEGPMGGTCLNRGCIPSKILIHHADVAETIRNSKKFHIGSKIGKINFAKIVEETNAFVDNDAKEIEQGVKEDNFTTLFKKTGEFVGERTLKVGNKEIFGEKVVVAAGTRPSIPPVEGLDKIPYLTSTEALRLKKLPKSMIFVGGGYISTELAYFFGAMGSKITIVQRNVRLVPNEDQEIADVFTQEFSKKYKVILEHTTKKVVKKGNKIIVSIQKKDGTGKMKTLEAEQIVVATGRVSNTDILKVEKAGIKTNKHGYIEVNKFMETSAKNVWALGDIAGKFFFKHSANLEARTVTHNVLNPDQKKAVDYTAIPHAVFSNPQIAGVGKTEEELKKDKIDYAIGKHFYAKTGMGKALKETVGFAKVLADRKTRKILGVHVIGPDSSAIIHEAIVAMKAADARVEAITETVHIHPSLSEVVERAFKRIDW